VIVYIAELEIQSHILKASESTLITFISEILHDRLHMGICLHLFDGCGIPMIGKIHYFCSHWKLSNIKKEVEVDAYFILMSLNYELPCRFFMPWVGTLVSHPCPSSDWYIPDTYEDHFAIQYTDKKRMNKIVIWMRTEVE
jgi:hypothetical protein